ncbi:MAG: DUF2225 domain-containing protein [Selenomonadaceae bacterium]|nr:DUF2225 domain-containing protein [Selenomonadaceae bacterium]
MLEKNFLTTRTCPVCEEKTRVMKTRSRLKPSSVDDDGCAHFSDFNLYYYTIWICENCGFAADEKTFMTRMPNRHLNILRKVLLNREIKIPFTEERTIEYALTSYRLALRYLDIISGKASKRAKFTHQLAWLYRDDGDKELEATFLKKAEKLYKEALETEHFPTENLTECTVHYLLATIHRRLNEPNEAVEYLSKVIHNPSARNQDYRAYEQAQELWEEMRAFHQE